MKHRGILARLRHWLLCDRMFMVLKTEPHRLFQQCPCGYESVGWAVGKPKLQVVPTKQAR